MWDDNGNIGKRYRRHTKSERHNCMFIDFDTLDSNQPQISDTTGRKGWDIKDKIR